MSLPASSPYVVVGAGIHGLSTGYHLAKELEARGLGSGADIIVARQVGAGRGSVGHRLRRRAQQLLPAGDERAHAGLRRGLGVRPGRLRLQPASATWRSAPARPGVGSRRDLRASGEDRLPLASSSSGEAEVDAYMKALFPDWRAKGVTVVPARAPGRLRLQQGLRHGPGRQVRVGRVCAFSPASR